MTRKYIANLRLTLIDRESNQIYYYLDPTEKFIKSYIRSYIRTGYDFGIKNVNARNYQMVYDQFLRNGYIKAVYKNKTVELLLQEPIWIKTNQIEELPVKTTEYQLWV